MKNTSGSIDVILRIVDDVRLQAFYGVLVQAGLHPFAAGRKDAAQVMMPVVCGPRHIGLAPFALGHVDVFTSSDRKIQKLTEGIRHGLAFTI